MTNLQKECLQKAIPAFLTAKDISANQLALKCKVSAATISNMRNGKFQDIDNALCLKVWNVVNPNILSGLHQTNDFQTVFNACESAINNRFMIGLTGDTGMGKTTACKAFAMRPNVFYVYIDATVNPKVFLKDLLRNMAVPFEGTINAMLNRVAEHLNTVTNPLLIIDECGKLNQKMILTLHSLRDKTMNNAGLLLAGMPDFKNMLIRQKTAGIMGYAEFFRRINLWQELTGLTADEITYILQSNGITEKTLQREFKKYNLFGDLMNEVTLYKTVNPTA